MIKPKVVSSASVMRHPMRLSGFTRSVKYFEVLAQQQNASKAQEHQGFLQRIYNDVALSAPAIGGRDGGSAGAGGSGAADN
jgi:hypothetical protein